MPHTYEVVPHRHTRPSGERSIPGQAGPRDLTGLLLSIQRTAGNRAVNQLLQRWALLPVQRDDGDAHTPTQPGSATQTPPPPAPPSHRAAVTIWHDSVVDPLTAAQEEINQGPKHFSAARDKVGSTFTAIKAITGTFDQNPLARQRIAEFHELIELIVTDLAVVEQEPVFSGNFLGGTITEAIFDAALIGPTLDANIKAQSGGKSASPNAAPGLWQAEVITPLQTMQSFFLDGDPAGEKDDKKRAGYAEHFLPALNRIREGVMDVLFGFEGDEIHTRQLVTFVHKVDRIIAMATGAAHKTMQPWDAVRGLENAVNQARNLEQRLGDGSMDQPEAKTTAKPATP